MGKIQTLPRYPDVHSSDSGKAETDGEISVRMQDVLSPP